MLTPAKAYWNQRHALSRLIPRLLEMGEVIGQLNNPTYCQWAQTSSMLLEFKPDLILELGRGEDSLTCALTETAHFLGNAKVVSLGLDRYIIEQMLPKLFQQGCITANWLKHLEYWVTDIPFFDFENLFNLNDKIILFWRASDFDVASCVLGKILPILQHKKHIVLVNQIADSRYMDHKALQYQGQRLWKGNGFKGRTVTLGNIYSSAEKAVALTDFSSRNNFEILSCQHSNHSEIESCPEKVSEMQSLLGNTFFSLEGDWSCFSLNDSAGPFTFPRFFLKDKPKVDPVYFTFSV